MTKRAILAAVALFGVWALAVGACSDQTGPAPAAPAPAIEAEPMERAPGAAGRESALGSAAHSPLPSEALDESLDTEERDKAFVRVLDDFLPYWRDMDDAIPEFVSLENLDVSEPMTALEQDIYDKIVARLNDTVSRMASPAGQKEVRDAWALGAPDRHKKSIQRLRDRAAEAMTDDKPELAAHFTKRADRLEKRGVGPAPDFKVFGLSELRKKMRELLKAPTSIQGSTEGSGVCYDGVRVVSPFAAAAG